MARSGGSEPPGDQAANEPPVLIFLLNAASDCLESGKGMAGGCGGAPRTAVAAHQAVEYVWALRRPRLPAHRHGDRQVIHSGERLRAEDHTEPENGRRRECAGRHEAPSSGQAAHQTLCSGKTPCCCVPAPLGAVSGPSMTAVKPEEKRDVSAVREGTGAGAVFWRWLGVFLTPGLCYHCI